MYASPILAWPPQEALADGYEEQQASCTVLADRLQVGEVVSTIPSAWYYPNTQAIKYVVDSSDTERVGTSREEFHAILQEEELKDALLLVYANKQVSVWNLMGLCVLL